MNRRLKAFVGSMPSTSILPRIPSQKARSTAGRVLLPISSGTVSIWQRPFPLRVSRVPLDLALGPDDLERYGNWQVLTLQKQNSLKFPSAS